MKEWFKIGFFFIGTPIFAVELLSFVPFEYLQAGLRTIPWTIDPFQERATVLKDKVYSGFELKGIVANEMVFINGRWHKKGDSIGGYVVTKIQPGSVTLIKNKDERVLRLKK